MASGTRGYSSYRGRGRKGKLFLAVLLILIILASVGFILGREHMTYDAEGNLHFPWPWARETAEPSASDAPGSDVVIQEPETDVKDDRRAEPISAVQLGEDPSEWEASLSGMENAFAVTLRADGGTLCYPFETTVAGRRLSQNAEAVRETLMTLLSGERYAIARLSCLRDGGAARENLETMGLENTGGYIFYDGNNENWLDPGKADTVDYLAALAQECAALGFDEILLTGLAYPTEGKLDKIAFAVPDGETDGSRAETLAALLRTLRETLPADVKLSLELAEPVLENGGVDETAGIDLWGLLMPYLDHVYVPTVAERAEALTANAPQQDVLIPELPAGSVPMEGMSCLYLN